MIQIIGNKKIKQVEGTCCDDIRFVDIHTNREITFDEFIDLITNEK